MLSARLLLAGGLLGCALALGAMRAAAADTSAAASSVARLATGQRVLLHGVVVAEPDLRATYRLLTVEVSEANGVRLRFTLVIHDDGVAWVTRHARLAGVTSVPPSAGWRRPPGRAPC